MLGMLELLAEEGGDSLFAGFSLVIIIALVAIVLFWFFRRKG